MMKRTPLLSLGIAGLGAAALPTSARAQAQAPRTEQDRPNVIVILADDLGFGDISCNGSRTIATPNIDRIAAEGIRFTNAHTTSSTSTPARFGLLTGIYPWRVPGTGIAPGDAGMIIRPGTPTLASTLRDAGYTTGAVGKWHLGLGESGRQEWNGHITPGLEEIGFDYSFIMAATGDRVPCVYIENQRVYNYDPEAPISVSYKENFPGEPTGRDNPELLRLHPSHGHDMSIVNGISRIGYMKGGGKALWKDEEIADVITGKAVEFIEKNRKRPFFLYFGTNDIHVPRVPHKRFAGRSGMGARGDAILSFDWSVGRIARVLDSLGIADRTILIVTSDNGPVVDDGYRDRAVELLGDHRPWHIYRGGKYSAFEAGTRVPFIVRWDDGARAGTVSGALVSQIDLFATLARRCGARIPEAGAPDSRPALAVLRGETEQGRSWVVEQNANGTLSILSGGWKYIAPSRGAAYLKATNTELGNAPEPQLYDLREDAGERHNVAAEHPDVVELLRSLLDEVKRAGGTARR